MMDFEWDHAKNKANFKKRGLRFEDAALVFESKTFTFLDDRKDYGENRYVTLGQLAKRVVVMVHTQRGNRIRIISLRKANEREKKIYHERLEKSG